jgi:hypothetical protein
VKKLETLGAVSLNELAERADLQVRRDRKYVCPTGSIETLLSQLPDQTRVLEIDGRRSFGYSSTYFDTPEFVSFNGAAHRRRRRFKVRARTYLDTGQSWMEVKTCGAMGRTVKDRIPLAQVESDRQIADMWQWVSQILKYRSIPNIRVARLAPTLTVAYQRSTLLLPGNLVRVTVDSDISWNTPLGRQGSLPGMGIVETKSPGSSSVIDKALWGKGHRPDRISKYATGFAYLTPGTQTNRWNRTIERYFEATRVNEFQLEAVC